MTVNIVSLITCKVSGLSYVGITKNGRLDDPSLFSPLRYGFGPRFIEAVRRYGPDAFNIKILGHEYTSREELCLARSEFIERYNTLWPNGYNVQLFFLDSAEEGANSTATAQQKLSKDSDWRAAVTAAATKRKQSSGWRVALTKRSRNNVWRHNISSARPPYLHTRWHVKTGLVPPGTPVENCDLCKEAAQRKEQPKRNERPKVVRIVIPPKKPVVNKWVLTEPIEIPPISLEEELDDQVRRINEMFKRK